jgi:hypothetical protein
MGGANTGTNKIGQTQLAAGTVPKATLATQADLAAFDRQQAQSKRLAQGLDFFAKGIQGIDFSTNEMSKAKESQSQAEAYQKWLEMQKMLQENPDALNFMPMMPFQIRDDGRGQIAQAYGNAGKDLAGGILGAVGTMYGRK